MILIRWLISALTLMLVAYLVPGVAVASFYTALVLALVLGFLNAIIRPLLIFLTFPITILTLGLFAFIINAGLFLFASSFVKGFEVDGFVSALVGSLLLWVMNWMINGFLDVTKGGKIRMV
ncbi:MAG: phage holin family protein [Candidatus Kerfeldbacteria bacterium]|nr:phage holin family protein [Candidatus Kerfeldbacteria bacterium]